MDKILSDGRGILRESFTAEEFRAVFVAGVPEIASVLSDEGIHLQVAVLGDQVITRLRSGDLAVPVRIVELLHQVLAGSQPAAEVANALQISFPSLAELAVEPLGSEFIANIPASVRQALAGV